MQTAIKVEQLSKSYGNLLAIDQISLSVKYGTVYGLLGANGAGKSTTIECILGTKKADSGTVSVLGLNPKEDRRRLFQNVGVQFQENNYQPEIKVSELCDETACLYKAPADWKTLCEKFGIGSKIDHAVKNLSGGERQRLFIVLALIPNPKLVFLDELTTGLDTKARRDVWKILSELKDNGLTIFLTSHFMDEVKNNEDGKLVLVTAINPTPAGEGKTTTSVGVSQALNKLGKKTICALREPSLGPCFGIKGGAAGGGYAQVVPMEDLNLHFTGDFHAITSANNLLAAMLDNHIQQGNKLNIDTRDVVWKRCIDMNDRALRNTVIGLGRRVDGVVREDHFVITVASEIMAILCLANDMADLKERLGKIIVAYNMDREPVTAKDLNAVGAMAALLKDAIKPNMIQTLEHTPAFVHGGPFANIAHGCNSVQATKLALKLADIAITEAGFGADLGAEKFMDIKCQMADLHPDAVVLVATVRALKYNGGVPKDNLAEENIDALSKGIVNLEKHIENLKLFGVPVVVTLNQFATDTEAELTFIKNFCEERDCDFALSQVWEKGGEGGIELAKAILRTLDNKESNYKPLYTYDDTTIEEKIETIATKIYGADKVVYTAAAARQKKRLTELGYGNLPICMAKNQYSLSDDPKKLGRPEGFDITIREIYVNAGAGFLVALTGDVMTMPGLPKKPAAEGIDVNDDGVITGLF